MKIIFAAGGTAGHINPALAIADKIKEVLGSAEVLFIGTPDSLEERLVTKAGYDFKAIKMGGIQRSLSPKQLKRTFKAIGYYIKARSIVKQILSEFKPDIVIGTGGYVTAPVLSVAVKMKIKTATHESNSLPGITTKMLSKKVDRVYLNSADALKHLSNNINYLVTGNPLRSKVSALSREDARKELGLPEGFTILSFGGSLGANRISKAVAHLIKWENDKQINHIHSYGGNGKELFWESLKAENVTPNSERTRLLEYIHNMYVCLCAADLVICRAGAMTLSELQAAGRASVLIPYPNAAENHQFYNAKTMEKDGSAIVIEDKNLTGERLVLEVKRLMGNKELLARMGENAKKSAIENSADIVVSDLLDLV